MNIHFFRTAGIILRHPYCNNYRGILRHIFWQFRKFLNLFPCTLRFSRSLIIIHSKIVANGCGALINAMDLYDADNMLFLQDIFSRKLASVFFDVGANIGAYSILAAENPEVIVHSFEPHPVTAKYLKDNAKLNGYQAIRVHTLALSDHEGKALLTNIPGSSVNRIMDRSEPGGTEVQLSTVSAVCKGLGTYPEIIKIDTEGNDNAVIGGCDEDVFKILNCVIVESLDDSGHIIKHLLKHGFNGPYEINFQAKKMSFSQNIKNANEDFIFLKRAFLHLLESDAGYTC